MGKIFYSLCSQYFTVETSCTNSRSQNVFHKGVIGFYPYKCFLQCWHKSEVFLITYMKLFLWFCEKLCQIHFHTSHTYFHSGLLEQPYLISFYLVFYFGNTLKQIKTIDFTVKLLTIQKSIKGAILNVLQEIHLLIWIIWVTFKNWLICSLKPVSPFVIIFMLFK